MGVIGEIVFRAGVEIGKVAAAATGDENFFANTIVMLQQEHRPPAQSGGMCTHQARAAGAHNDGVKMIRSLAHAAKGLIHVEQFIGIKQAEGEVGQVFPLGPGQGAGGSKLLSRGMAIEQQLVTVADLFIGFLCFLSHTRGKVPGGLTDEIGIQ